MLGADKNNDDDDDDDDDGDGDGVASNGAPAVNAVLAHLLTRGTDFRRRLGNAFATRRRRVFLVALGLCAVVAIAFTASLQRSMLVPVPSTLVLDRFGHPFSEVAAPPPAPMAAVAGPDNDNNDNDDDDGDDATPKSRSAAQRDDERFGYWPLPAILPMRLVVATIETEDRRFFEHAGVSPSAIARALRQNLEAARVISGASTIAMQVARMQSGRRRSLLAKSQEAVEAISLVSRYGHDAILRQYLTLAPYGARVHGAERAARFYFDKPSADLSWLQAAWIAGLPQQPTRLGPFVDGGLARGLKRAHQTLRQLHARGYLDDDDLRIALHSDLNLVAPEGRPANALHTALAIGQQVRAARRHGERPLTVQTTLDLSMQDQMATIVEDNLQRVRGYGATNGAALVVDVETGEIRSWIGSTDYFDVDDHGAIDFVRARRSPGSTLKPFVYALALDPASRSSSDTVFTAATPLEDIPMDIIADNGRSYLPKNINRTFLGPMSLRSALGNSRNIPALRMVSEVGVERALTFFDEAGVDDVDFTPGRYGLGLALGNLHVTPLELARLYLTLAHHGRSQSLHLSDLDDALAATHAKQRARGDVVDSDGDFVDVVADEQPPRALLAPEAADLVTNILSDPAARKPSFPEGSALDYDLAVAVKTGTSQGYRDGWTVAFSDRLLIVMWVGNHDWRRMNHLGGLAGTADAVHAAFDLLSPRYQPHIPAKSHIDDPARSTRVEVCALSGQRSGPHCPHRRSEVFLEGTAPQGSCAWHHRVAVDIRNGDLANDQCPAAMVRPRVVVDLPSAYARWARQQQLPLLPHRVSRLCGGDVDGPVHVALREPHNGVAYRFDPDTPAAFATVRLAADVEGARDDDEVVFLVDNSPVASVPWPFETRWTLTPGAHEVRAVVARRSVASAPSHIMVR